MTRALLLIGVVVLLAIQAGAMTPARVRFLWPRQTMFNDERVTWLVIVEQHEENRVLVLVADGEGGSRQSAIQLDGDKAPRTHRIDWWSMPAGEYDVVAALFDSSKEVARASVPVQVLARF